MGKYGPQNAKLRVATLAAQQSGRVSRGQLHALEVTDSQIRNWTRAGYLIRRLPCVFAVGHTAPSVAAVLTEAALYAGPNAMLSHATGAWWLGLLEHRPTVTQVSTPRRCKSLPGLEIHSRRDLQRIWHRCLPVAPVAHVLLDLACSQPRWLRHALAQAEYHGYLEIDTLESLIGQGRPGTIALREALKSHQPQLARTRTDLERAFLALCERENLPIPEFNVWVEGFLVDALWREQRVVVEVDGRDGHSSWARIRKDRRRDLALRRAAYTPLRYVWEQVTEQVPEVADDVRRAIALGPPPRLESP